MHVFNLDIAQTELSSCETSLLGPYTQDNLDKLRHFADTFFGDLSSLYNQGITKETITSLVARASYISAQVPAFEEKVKAQMLNQATSHGISYMPKLAESAMTGTVFEGLVLAELFNEDARDILNTLRMQNVKIIVTSWYDVKTKSISSFEGSYEDPAHPEKGRIPIGIKFKSVSNTAKEIIEALVEVRQPMLEAEGLTSGKALDGRTIHFDELPSILFEL